MRSRISIRGCVRPSVRPSVGPSVRPSVRPSVGHTRVETMQKCRFDQDYYQYEQERILWPCIRPCSFNIGFLFSSCEHQISCAISFRQGLSAVEQNMIPIICHWTQSRTTARPLRRIIQRKVSRLSDRGVGFLALCFLVETFCYIVACYFMV